MHISAMACRNSFALSRSGHSESKLRERNSPCLCGSPLSSNTHRDNIGQNQGNRTPFGSSGLLRRTLHIRSCTRKDKRSQRHRRGILCTSKSTILDPECTCRGRRAFRQNNESLRGLGFRSRKRHRTLLHTVGSHCTGCPVSTRRSRMFHCGTLRCTPGNSPHLVGTDRTSSTLGHTFRSHEDTVPEHCQS